MHIESVGQKHSLQTTAHEIDEVLVVGAQYVRQWFCAGLSFAVLRVGDAARIAARVEEQATPRRLVQHLFGRHVEHFHDAG